MVKDSESAIVDTGKKGKSMHHQQEVGTGHQIRALRYLIYMIYKERILLGH